jgi:hypothetical protein
MGEYPSDDFQEVKVCHMCPLQTTLSLKCCWVGSGAACEAVIVTQFLLAHRELTNPFFLSIIKWEYLGYAHMLWCLGQSWSHLLLLTLYLVPVQASSWALLRSIAVRYNKLLTKEQDALKHEH